MYGCGQVVLFNQTTLVSPAAYTRYNASLTAQLGLAWALN